MHNLSRHNIKGKRNKKRNTIRQTGALLFAFLLLVFSLGAVPVRATDEAGNTADDNYTPTVVDNVQSVEKVYTITYVYDDGSSVPDDEGNPLLFTFEVTFERSGDVDPETGAITQWGDWYPVEIPEVPSPEIEGYTPDKTSAAQVDGATPDNWPENVVVTYTKNAEPEPDSDLDPTPDPEPPPDPEKDPDPTPAKTVTPAPAVTKTITRAPKTGDPNMPGLWFALGTAAVLLIGMIRRSRQ